MLVTAVSSPMSPKRRIDPGLPTYTHNREATKLIEWRRTVQFCSILAEVFYQHDARFVLPLMAEDRAAVGGCG